MDQNRKVDRKWSFVRDVLVGSSKVKSVQLFLINTDVILGQCEFVGTREGLNLSQTKRVDRFVPLTRLSPLSALLFC